MKYGVRIHWGLYSVAGLAHESWPFLDLSYAERAHYNEIYKSWNPAGFDADEWTSLFADNGMRMFAFTTKHHEGFSMFDTRTRVRQRIRWDAAGGPALENSDLAYSIMETPFRRDIVKELCAAGRKRRSAHRFVFFPPRLVRRGFPSLCRSSGASPFLRGARPGMDGVAQTVRKADLDGPRSYA